jgi:hypothetical protein
MFIYGLGTEILQREMHLGITAFTVDFVETDQLNHGFFRANSLKAQGATGG